MINYGILHESLEYYSKHGFKRIELPWTVTAAISNITRPPEGLDFTINEKNKVLVASGEQSFLYLYNKGFLPMGKFMGITPCYRNDSFDALHTKYFIKNELIITDDVSHESLKFIVDCARNFFRQYVKDLPHETPWTSTGDDDVLIIDTVNGRDIAVDEVDCKNRFWRQSYDLTFRGIELGSYGIRKCDYLHWIYGTGCPEPRLSAVINKFKIRGKY